MLKFVPFVLITAVFVCAAQDPAHFPYDEDAVPSKPAFDPQGRWRVDGIEGLARVSHLRRKQRNRLVGTDFQIRKGEATLWNGKVMSWKQPFPAPVNGQTVYDTHSREFWLDFRTDPKSIHLPRYVTSIDIELGNILVVDPGHILLDYQGVWYRLSRTTQS